MCLLKSLLLVGIVRVSVYPVCLSLLWHDKPMPFFSGRTRDVSPWYALRCFILLGLEYYVLSTENPRSDVDLNRDVVLNLVVWNVRVCDVRNN